MSDVIEPMIHEDSLPGHESLGIKGTLEVSP